jgi:hypothetical protein
MSASANYLMEVYGILYKVEIIVKVEPDVSLPSEHTIWRANKEATTILEDLLKSHPESIRNSIR